MNADSPRTLANFIKALGKLHSFLVAPIADERDKAGIIQAFEYTFELAWKTIQKMTVVHGKQVGSARQAFQAAFELGWLEESSMGLWTSMIEDRNLTSHTYREEIADQVLARVKSQHVVTLDELCKVLSAQS